ncbi:MULTISPECIES: YgjV family protein [Galbibacter]|uniref:YgjV family protein n=1 Tax=Galbibacter pacificus TaxID=2996052 RepID=A0ABT6FMH9_9FLAO|nr:YgjV family protein [Galbibacter pacificus]MDG3580914.1 YgjV family protein [Galbibacter pacificus]MDG3584392.1 YgjV family protein [Galbibacter pacificus]
MEYFNTSITELIGYAASLGVLLSFFMKEIRRLRIVNSIGCLLFVIYGAMLPSIPIIITNAAILGVNFYYLLIRRK